MGCVEIIKEEIFETLKQVAIDAKEPMIGAQVFSFFRGNRIEKKICARALRELCEDGKVQRSGGWCWIHPDMFNEIVG